MSAARILFSGILVAAGLVLGTFTMLGYLDPTWAERELAAVASQQQRSGEPDSVSGLRGRSRFVAGRDDAREDLAARPPIVRTGAMVSKAPARKKAAEKAGRPQQQAAAFQWPWKLFGN